MLHFFYDADSEMSLAVAKEFGIDDPRYFIKMPYTISGELKYCDLLTPEVSDAFFKKLRAGEMPSTSALNAEEYKEIFEPAFREGGDILYVSFSSKMSATFEHMDLAVKELKQKYPAVTFTRIDSKAISMGAGLAVIAAAKAVKAGKSVAEIVKYMDELIPRINITIVADDLNYLKRGGRLTAIKALFGTMLQIKPIIKLTTAGTLIPTTNVTGRNKALMTMVAEVADRLSETDDLPVFIMQGDCPAEAERVRAKLQSLVPGADIRVQDVGPVIGTHCGPGTIGICFIDGQRPEPVKE